MLFYISIENSNLKNVCYLLIHCVLDSAALLLLHSVALLLIHSVAHLSKNSFRYLENF